MLISASSMQIPLMQKQTNYHKCRETGRKFKSDSCHIGFDFRFCC